MRQHGATARRRHRRCGRLGNGIAGAAGIFRPHVADRLEAAGHVVQHRGHVLAQLAHAAAAGRANAGAVTLALMEDLKARQVIGERLALWLRTRGGWSFGLNGLDPGDLFGLAGLQFPKLQLQLFNLARNALRGPAKLHPAQLSDPKAQFFNLQRLERHHRLSGLQLTPAGRREGAQGGGMSGQFGSGERHAQTYQGLCSKPESMRDR
jgi:hypothetical protein